MKDTTYAMQQSLTFWEEYFSDEDIYDDLDFAIYVDYITEEDVKKKNLNLFTLEYGLEWVNNSFGNLEISKEEHDRLVIKLVEVYNNLI